MEEATAIRKQLCDLLNIAGMKLRKWRTSNDEFRKTIPNELVETEDLHLSSSSSQAPKALGIYWNVTMDQLHISIPTPSTNSKVTKRLIASESAKVFDVLGFFAPSTILPKILLQNLWQRQLSWDETVPDSILQQWKDWISPSVSTADLSRSATEPLQRKDSIQRTFLIKIPYHHRLRWTHQCLWTSSRLQVSTRTKEVHPPLTPVKHREAPGIHLTSNISSSRDLYPHVNYQGQISHSRSAKPSERT